MEQQRQGRELPRELPRELGRVMAEERETVEGMGWGSEQGQGREPSQEQERVMDQGWVKELVED